MGRTSNPKIARIMARFITLHREILRERLEKVEAYVNVEQITYISPQSGKTNRTFVGLPSGFVEAIESPEEIINLIRRKDW